MIDFITLTNDQALSLNYIDVMWNGNADLDLDLFAILLDKGDKLIEDGDFVFYNSENRTVPFDPDKWHSRSCWRNNTLPISVDGSVMMVKDAPIDEDNEDDWGECMFIDLFKTRPEINKILLFLAVYDDTGSRSLSGIKSIRVRLKQHESLETIFSSKISKDFTTEKVITVCSLQRKSDGLWSVGDEVIGYNDIQAILSKYIPK